MCSGFYTRLPVLTADSGGTHSPSKWGTRDEVSDRGRDRSRDTGPEREIFGRVVPLSGTQYLPQMAGSQGHDSGLCEKEGWRRAAAGGGGLA